jgi:tetratricopeptide (TPR) repeat protein
VIRPCCGRVARLHEFYTKGMVRQIVGLCFVLALASCSSTGRKQKALAEGNAFFANGKDADAVAKYGEALKVDPRLALAYYGQGRSYLRMRNYSEAEGAFRRALDLLPPGTPERDDASIQLAYVLVHAWNESKLTEVERVAVDLCKRDAKSFEGRQLLGELALVRARKRGSTDVKFWNFLMEDAVDEFRIAANVRPNDAAVQLGLARSFAGKGMASDSEKAYRRTLALDKSKPEVYAELYRILIAQGKLPDAEQVLRNAIVTLPSHQGFSVMLAAHVLATDAAKAPPLIEQLKSKDTALPSPNLIAGDFYLRAGDLDRAKQEYQRCISAGKSELACRVRLIRIALFQNNARELKDSVQATLKADHNNVTARAVDDVFKLRAGDIDSAERELRRLLDTDTDGPFARYYLARIQVRQGQLSDASQTLTVALQRRPDYLQARLLLAEVQLALRNFTNAKESAEAVLEGQSNNAEARAILEAAKSEGKGSNVQVESYLSNPQWRNLTSKSSGGSAVGDLNPSIKDPVRLKDSVCDVAIAAFNKMKDKNYDRVELIQAVPGVWSTAALAEYVSLAVASRQNNGGTVNLLDPSRSAPRHGSGPMPTTYHSANA